MVEKMSLEERIDRLEKECERLAAVKACCDLMSRYEYYLCGGVQLKAMELFAKRDDTLMQVATGWGHYKGWDSIYKLFVGFMTGLEKDMGTGLMFEHHLDTSLVEVAGDGKTAKGIWMTSGHETGPIPPKKGAPIKAGWCWGKFACDFIKENGEWKIWHCFGFPSFNCDFYKSWAEEAEHAAKDVTMSANKRSSGPDLFPSTVYDPTKVREYLPAAPEPYETYDEKEGIYWIYPKK
jgi:hypothetical protein